ncbi:hypothetical protein [Haloquadratum walsbyi]
MIAIIAISLAFIGITHRR